MDSTELHESPWNLAEAATSRSARVRWPTPLRSAVSQILVWREALAGPAELWWRSHGRRMLRIVALIAGGIAFLLVAHIVLSLLNPPSGL